MSKSPDFNFYFKGLNTSFELNVRNYSHCYTQTQVFRGLEVIEQISIVLNIRTVND